MKYIIKKILFLPSHLWNKTYNLFYLKVTGVTYFNDLKINGRLFVRNHGKLAIGKKAIINSKYLANPIGGDQFTTFFVAQNAILEIGDGLNLSNATIFCKHHIRIGNNVMIGGSTKIYDTDFHSIHVEDRLQKGDINAKSLPIIIEDNVFIGGHSLILKGVRIGKGSVIGAGSVLTKSTEENEVWAGNPATFIKKLVPLHLD